MTYLLDPSNHVQLGHGGVDSAVNFRQGLQLSLQSSSFESVLATVERFSPDATLLITSLSVASPFLQEWAVRGKIGKWYLGPTLKNPELVRNVPRGVLEGFSGIDYPQLGRTFLLQASQEF